MCRNTRIWLTMIAVLAVAVPGFAAIKAVPKKAAKPVVVKMPTGPKLFSIVAGQPFESIPSSGSAKLAVTLCPEETAPATFSVRYGKTLGGVTAAPSDLVGPGKITKDNVSVKVVQGESLVSATGVELGTSPTQFWVDTTVPKNTKAGIYRGYISFSVAGKQIDVEPLEVNVRGLRLVGSSKQYMLYTCAGPSCEGASCLTGDEYSKFVGSAAKLGFMSVAVGGDVAKAGEAFGACASAGMIRYCPVLSFANGTTVPSMDDVKAMAAAGKSAGLQSMFCFCANLPHGDAEVQSAADRASLFKRCGVQIGATVEDEATLAKLMPVVDGINYRYDMPYVQALINGGGNRTSKWEWYWWDARQSVSDNRIRSGVALWRSGLYGCMPFWMPKTADEKVDDLDSLQCEALREGVTDTRYITTYMKALRELKDKKREKDKDYIASTESYLASFMSKPLDKVTTADIRGLRAKMAEYSVKLAAML